MGVPLYILIVLFWLQKSVRVFFHNAMKKKCIENRFSRKMVLETIDFLLK